MSRPKRTQKPREPVSGSTPQPSDGRSGLGTPGWLGLGALFAGLALAIVWPAIDGEFLSDDFLYIVNNPAVHGLSLENVLAILHPYGSPTVYTLNWAPVHLLMHAAEYEIWGESTRGYHVVNALAHAACSLVFVVFLLRTGLPRAAAVAGALLFLVHPANVETTAWIFQLKTIVALILTFGALLLHARHPGWAALCFGLALLTKIQALAALPAVAVQAWVRSADGREPPRWGWVAGWVLIALAVSVPEMAAFQRQSDVRLEIHEDPLVHARTIVAYAMRYLVMAYTSIGVATFQEPPPAESWLDPWWLAGVACLGVLGWRTWITTVRRQEEAVQWWLAAASFAPVSQIFPFIFPMGDRYLYPILPGLIGGALLALRPAWERLPQWATEHFGWTLSRQSLVRITVAAALVLAVVFGVRSVRRAPVFENMVAMMRDSALAFPDGMQASLLRGHNAALAGRVSDTARAYQRAIDLGFSDLAALLNNPTLARFRGHPEFEAMLRSLAERDIVRLGGREELDQSEALILALAYYVNGQLPQAVGAYELAIELGGPFTRRATEELRMLRATNPQLGGAGSEPTRRPEAAPNRTTGRAGSS